MPLAVTVRLELPRAALVVGELQLVRVLGIVVFLVVRPAVAHSHVELLVGRAQVHEDRERLANFDHVFQRLSL